MSEFDDIARLFRPLTRGAPEALDLLDDAAVIPSRPGFDLVVTKDAMVAGVHFPPDDPPDLVGRKLLRVNLSDLAAKGATPYAAFLAVAWPPSWGSDARAGFARGLGEDLAAFDLVLLGGDTVSTPGPFTASLTLLGWVAAGCTVRRSGARPGEVVLVSGTVGDGTLGLAAARGEIASPWLADRYRLPQPRLALRPALLAHASAAADVSDGLAADAGHLARASGVGIELELERLPLSPPAAAWVAAQADRAAALGRLATGGDDYEIVCTAAADRVGRLVAEAAALGVPLRPVGMTTAGAGVRVILDGAGLELERTGWTHG